MKVQEDRTHFLENRITYKYPQKNMRTIKFLIVSIICELIGLAAYAQERRPIDAQHPLWMIHVDVWNQADPQKIIDLIPADIKPYVCMNLSLSCSYDTAKNVYIRPQNAIRTYKSWASVCQNNGMWFTCQPASGGHTHIQDNDLETFEYFFKHYPNFLGWNYAEQFWGFDEAGDKSSSSQAGRIALFAKLVPMHHKYGGFLTISFCGNIWSHPLNPVGMMKRNADLLQACKDYPEAILWLYKYTTSSCFYNNESVTFGPFVAGLAKNYGVRYDNCGYNGALDAILGSGHGCKYPVAAGIGTVMEQTCQNGGAVWDGPELIWTEDFQNLSNTTVNGYTQRNWGTFAGFRNIWMDMFRKVIDGTMYIPTRQEVVNKTQFIIVNDVTSGSDEDKYATWADLYDGLYKQTDPMNTGNGQWMNNYCYFKSTGRYGTIPMTPCIADNVAAAITNKIKKSQRSSVWSSIAAKTLKFNSAYPTVSTGDLFVSRFKNQLVTYTPYTYLNSKTTAKANIPLKYNTCQSIDLSYGKLSSGIIREYADSITCYLNNYRSDTTTNTNDIIIVNGASEEPAVTYSLRTEAKGSLTTSWDADKNSYTINVSHNGPIDLCIKCSGSNSERETDILPSAHLDAPLQPAPFCGELIIEAEDMNYKSIKSCETTPYYSGYNWVRGHAGNGFIDMGTSTSGALTRTFNVSKAGDYTVTIRYTNTAKTGDLRIKANSNTSQKVSCPLTNKNEWNKSTVTTNLNEGSNTITVYNTAGIGMFIDQVIITPTDIEKEKFGIVVREAENGSVTADYAEAEEGTKVTLTPTPAEGYYLAGWNIIHGDITLTDDNTFIMPDDNVTIQPIFADATMVYEMDMQNTLTGKMPKGWRATDGTDIHEYPNSYSSGPRTMSGFNGSYSKALYWRNTSADYGSLTDCPLTLETGKYKMTYIISAWKSNPTYTAQILDSDGNVIAQSASMAATPNANGSSTADLSDSPVQTIEFTVTKQGNYIINFKSNGSISGYNEFLLCSCAINKIPDTADITSTAVRDIKDKGYDIYNIQGIRLQSLQKGLNIISHKGMEIKKIWIR